MASFKAKFPVLQELFAKNHRGALWAPPSGARVNIFHESGTVPVRKLELTMRKRLDPMVVKHILTNLMHRPSTPADDEFFMRDKTRRSSPRLIVRNANAVVDTRGNLTGRSGPDSSTWATVRGPRATKYLFKA